MLIRIYHEPYMMCTL